MKKMLIIYYSSDNGNTEKIAKRLQEATNCDIERIDLKTPYTGSYEEVVNKGKEEVESHATPELLPLQHDLKDYDVIAIGTPTWWYSMAPAVYSFIKNNDFKGKTIIPFTTSAGFEGETINNMKRELPYSDIKFEMSVGFDQKFKYMKTAEGILRDWLTAISNFINE